MKKAHGLQHTNIGQTCWPSFEDARDAIFIADTKTGRLIDCNRQAERLLKRTKSDIVGRSQSEIHPPEKAAYYKKIFQEHIRTKGRRPIEGEVVQKDGKRVSVEITAQVLKGPGGKTVLQGTFRNITERKKIIDQLRTSKDRFQAAFEAPSIGMAIVGLDGKWIQVNPALCKFLGYSEQQLRSGKYQDITHPDDLKKSKAAMRRLATGKAVHVQFEKRYIQPDRSIRYAKISASLVRDEKKKPLYVVSIIEDITEQVTTQKALQESEAKFRDLAEKSLISIYLIQDDMFRYVNPQFASIFGYQVSEIVDKIGPKQLTLQEDRTTVMSNIEQRLKGRVETVHYRFNGLTKDGHIRRIEALGSRTIYRGKPAIIGSLLDVTESERKDFELRDRAAELNKFKLAVSGASDHIIITDPDGMILYANHAAEKITGYRIDEMLGKNPGQLWGGKMEHGYYVRLWDTVKNKKKPYTAEVQNHRKNGEIYMAEMTITPILNEENEVIFFVGIERDITKAKEIDRMKSEFISVASHQLRTPLSTAGWYADMLANGDAGSLTEQQKKFVKEIARANQRSIALINALLSVSRIDSGKMLSNPKSISVATITQTAISSLRQLMERNNVTVSEKLDSKIPNVFVDPDIVSLAVQNLLSNAIKYTPAGGKVTIQGRLCEGEICMDVIDTGIGIPKNVQERIFTKFFRADNARSKDPDGTGLGLYIAKSAVELLGGKIWFQSSEGRGSTFTFTIPTNHQNHKRDLSTIF